MLYLGSCMIWLRVSDAKKQCVTCVTSSAGCGEVTKIIVSISLTVQRIHWYQIRALPKILKPGEAILRKGGGLFVLSCFKPKKRALTQRQIDFTWSNESNILVKPHLPQLYSHTCTGANNSYLDKQNHYLILQFSMRSSNLTSVICSVQLEIARPGYPGYCCYWIALVGLALQMRSGIEHSHFISAWPKTAGALCLALKRKPVAMR